MSNNVENVSIDQLLEQLDVSEQNEEVKADNSMIAKFDALRKIALEAQKADEKGNNYGKQI